MSELHVTYKRAADGTRVVFVLPMPKDPAEAIQDVLRRAPLGFQLVAACEFKGGQMRVPMNGDDYAG